MDTRIKLFSGTGSAVSNYLRNMGTQTKAFLSTPAGVISSLGLGISSYNAIGNRTKRSYDRKFQRQQMRSMDRLTGALGKVDKSLNKSMSHGVEKDEGGFIDSINIFKPKGKKFSDIRSKIVTGAGLGAGIGSVASQIPGVRDFAKGIIFKGRKAPVGDDKSDPTGVIMVGAGTLIGASLGLLLGGIQYAGKKLNQKFTTDNRNMSEIVSDLKRSGFREGKDFTRDPKRSSELQTKVCLVVSNVSGELNLAINTVADPKLDQVTKELLRANQGMKVIPGKKMTDKFNDITITSMDSKNYRLVSKVCSHYIRNKYPVYLVEVG